jgi:tellurite resistance protein TerC
MPLSPNYEGQSFFVKNRRWAATPLFVVLLVVESTDLIFAVDSVPAIFAVSRDPFIVYTSNVFAILGLRSLYFLLAGFINLFVYLRYGLGVVLGFVGIKMMLVDIYKIPIGISLAVVAGILALSIVASLFVQAESRGSSVFQFSFAGSFAKSNRFWIWLAIIGVVLAAVVLVQAASPVTIF